MNAKTLRIPKEVETILTTLRRNGFEAFVVGGSVRDMLLGKEPDDWDVATNALPEKIREIFPESFYENKFFTVTVKTGSDDSRLREVEVTTFRKEGRYEDKRHPAEIQPAETIEDDLSRRDFTVNAMAISPEGRVVDLFGGKKDLEKKLIRAVGEAEKRFEEDALRMLRGIRLAAYLGFSPEPETYRSIRKHAGWLSAISKERIRDEFSKILMAPQFPEQVMTNDYGATTDTGGKSFEKILLLERIGASQAWIGLEMLHDIGLLKHIVPELEAGTGCTQNKHHIFTVWEHNLRSLDYAVKQHWPLLIRIAALFHDIAKPHTKKGEGPDSTFYGHDVVGAKMSYDILMRLRYPEDMAAKISKLIRWHLFRYDYDVDEVQTTDSSIRRLIRNVGVENIEDLVKVRMCDRVGSGVPKAVPYRLRHFQFRVEKVLREHEAVKVTMLQVSGEDVMKSLTIGPGPKVGHILNALLEEVLDDPNKNMREYLTKRILELGKLSEKELIELRKKAESRVELLEDQREKEIKKKYYIK